jgi:hypothetical protein
MAGQSLLQADSHWLSQLITRRESLDNWQSALRRQSNDIKVVVDFTA